jgi:hypothetical protein
VGQSQADTWHVLIGREGCHVAQSRAATWHPIIGSLVNVKTFVLVAPGVEPATSGGQTDLTNSC